MSHSSETEPKTPLWYNDAQAIMAFDLYGERPPSIVEGITTILRKYQDESRIQIARYIASQNGRRVSEYFDLYDITDPNAKEEIAILAATNHARRTSWHFRNYQLEPEARRRNVAIWAAFSNGLGLAEFIPNYDLKTTDYLTEVARVALLNDPACLERLPLFFPDLHIPSVPTNPTPTNIVDWLKQTQPLIPDVIPTSAVNLYADMQRRDAGIRLLAGYLGNQQPQELSSIGSSRYALEQITDFPAQLLRRANLTTNARGDLYEVLTELQSKYRNPCFSKIKVEAELFDKAYYGQLFSFVNNFNLLSQLLGNKANANYQSIIQELGASINQAENISLNGQNISDLNRYLEQKIKKLFFSCYDGTPTFDTLDQLIAGWGDITPILALTARYHGRSSWQSELPVMAKVMSEVLRGTFPDYKYAVDKQIEGLSPEQLTAWRQNPSRIRVVENKIHSTDYREVLQSCQELADNFQHSDPSILSRNEIQEIGEGFKGGDKQLQKYLKKHFTTDSQAMMFTCLHYLISLNSAEEIKNGLSRIKSLKDLLKIDQQTKVRLDKMVAQLATPEQTDQLVFTTVFDDAKTLMSIGNIIRASSCINYNNGSEAPAILAGVIDAHTKGMASFVIDPETMGVKQFQQLLKTIKENAYQVECRFDGNTKTAIITVGQQVFRCPLGDAFHRRYLKVGQTVDGEVGIKLEKPCHQYHPLTPIIEDEVATLYQQMAQAMQAVTASPIYVAPSRNPLGSYSDVAVGHQSAGYWMN